jgi:hypothetical protein
METTHYGAQVNNKKSQQILGIKVFTGFCEVQHNGNYLYRTFTGITRLTSTDAIIDAHKMANDSFCVKGS